MKILELRAIILQEVTRLNEKGDLESGLKAGCIRRMLAQISAGRDNEKLETLAEVTALLDSITESIGASARTRSLNDILARHTNTLGFLGGKADAQTNVLEKIAGFFESEKLATQMSNGNGR